MAAVRNDPKLSGLKQHIYSPMVLGVKFEKGVTGLKPGCVMAGSFWRLQGRIFTCLFSASRSTRIAWLMLSPSEPAMAISPLKCVSWDYDFVLPLWKAKYRTDWALGPQHTLS